MFFYLGHLLPDFLVCLDLYSMIFNLLKSKTYICSIVGSMFIVLRKVALFGIGALGGFFIAMFILGLKSYGLIESGWGRIVFIGGFCLIGVVAIFFIEKHVVIFSTSIAGSYW